MPFLPFFVGLGSILWKILTGANLSAAIAAVLCGAIDIVEVEFDRNILQRHALQPDTYRGVYHLYNQENANTRSTIVDSFISGFHAGKECAIVGAITGGIFGALAPFLNLAMRFQLIQRLLNWVPGFKPAKLYLYVIDDAVTGFSKIGITKDPARRLAEISSQLGRKVNFSQLKLVANASAVERFFHNLFRARNVPSMPGREWFDLNVIDKVAIFAYP